MDKLRFLTESRNGKESVIEKLIHKDNSSSNRISCSIAEKSDIKSVMDVCFSRQQWMTEQGLNYVLCKDNRKFYRYKAEDRKLWVCKQSGEVMGFCVVEDHDINGYWKDSPSASFVYVYDCMTRPHKSVKETSDYSFLNILLNAVMEFYGKGIRLDVVVPNQRLESFYEKELGFNPLNKVIDEEDGSCRLLMEKSNNNLSLSESFTKKTSTKRRQELTSEISFNPENGLYILHETKGVCPVEGWNISDNEGVEGILIIKDGTSLIIALDETTALWAEKESSDYVVNRTYKFSNDLDSDSEKLSGKQLCQKLDSPEFPAAYFCLNYQKGNIKNWYLPSIFELQFISEHDINELNRILKMVGGTPFSMEELPCSYNTQMKNWYWASSESHRNESWSYSFKLGRRNGWARKDDNNFSVRPVAQYDRTLKESFTKKTKKSSNKDLVDIADKLATTTYDYNEENFKNKLRKETELYYKSEFYKVYHYPLDYRHNGDSWAADENGFHNMWLESTYWAARNEEVDFEGYCNDVDNNYAEPADVGIFVFGYGKDCVAYGEYEEYTKTHQLTESFVSKTKKKTDKDLQGKSDDVFNLDSLLREYVKSHCRTGSHNYDFYFTKENRPVFSDKEWEKLKGITVAKEIDAYYPPLHIVSPHGFTISNDFFPNVDDVFLFYIYKRRAFHIPVNRLPEKPLQELKEWILNVNESFVRKSSSKSSSDMVSDTKDFSIDELIKDFILIHGRYRKNPKYSHDLYLQDYRKKFVPFSGFDPYFVIVSDNYQNNQGKSLRQTVDENGNKIPYEISPGEVLISYSDLNAFGWTPLRILPNETKKKIYATMKVLEPHLLESFTRKTKQKSTEDIKQKADEHIGFKNLVKEIVLENDSFKENDILSKTFRNRQPRCTHALNKLRVRPTTDPTLSPYEINGTVVLDKSFYFKPEKYDISSLLAKNLTRKSMKDLCNSDSIIVLDRIYTMEYLGKELLRAEFNILRYDERMDKYTDAIDRKSVV